MYDAVKLRTQFVDQKLLVEGDCLILRSIEDKLKSLKKQRKGIKENIGYINSDVHKLKKDIDARAKKIKKLVMIINEKVDLIYKYFRRSVGVANIREYKENQLKAAQLNAEERLRTFNLLY